MCEVSELFEIAFARLSAKFDPFGLDELLLNFQQLAETDPALAGVPHPSIAEMLVFESPNLVRLPSIVFVFTADRDRGVVTLWNCRSLKS